MERAMNLKALLRDLKFTEYEAAQAVYAEALANDIPLERIIGIVYRQGWLNGRNEQRKRDAFERERRREYYQSCEYDKTKNTAQEGTE